MHVWFVARLVSRCGKCTPSGLGLAACAALLLAGCGGASPRQSTPDSAATPPEQVEQPGRGERTTSSITVSWRAPESDREITHYELRWRPVGAESWTVIPEIASSEINYEISGLQAGTEYEAQVRAVSAAGPGEWSASLRVATITTDAMPPTQPGSPSTGTVTSNSAVVTWLAPETDLTITKYLVQWIEAPGPNTTARPAAQGGIDWTSAETAETEGATPSITLDGLNPGTTYLVRVRAVTEEIDGHWSEPIEVTTSGSGGTETGGEVVSVLPAPTGLQGTANGETEIDVMWDAVTAPDGFALTGYRVEWKPGTSDWVDAAADTISYTVTSYTVTSLSAGTTYDLRVKAEGTGPDGEEVTSSPSGAITVATAGGVISEDPVFVLTVFDVPVEDGKFVVNESAGSVFISVRAVLDDTEEGRKHYVGVSQDVTVPVFIGVVGGIVPVTSPVGFQRQDLNAGDTGFTWKIAWDREQPMSQDGEIIVTIGEAITILVASSGNSGRDSSGNSGRSEEGGKE